jgi:gas vesicle protein
MDETEGHGGRGFLIGLILGALAGAAAGLLWSPRTGTENREKLAEALSNLGTNAPEELAQAADDLKARVESAREAFDQGVNETRARMQQELDESRKGDG